VTDIHIKDLSYELPEDRIAKYPLAERDTSKLLVYKKGDISHDVFRNITAYLPQGALMVYNNTRVIQARLFFQKESGARIEVFLLEPHAPRDYEQIFQAHGVCEWKCLVGNSKKWKAGALRLCTASENDDIDLQVERVDDSVCRFSWRGDLSFAELLERVGELPIPPYLNRHSEPNDKITYQTVYARIKGSVAAPTAGLHFTDRVLRDIDALGIEREEVTLHVGAGTFKPVKSETISGHEMHSEFISVKRSTIERLIAHGGRAVAVGTTSVRTLESLYYLGVRACNRQPVTEVEQWEPYETSPSLTAVEALEALLAWMDDSGLDVLHASTRIIIVPGYKYHIVERLITNFHQPQSTLLLLVSALIGDDWHKVYDYALSHDFRFLSYGDSSILIP
jgi:S-adenosylmethionine:tRNA ribosyltransferase-isomerase